MFRIDCSLRRETLNTILGTLDHEASVVLAGSSSGGVGAFNVASWLLDTFDQVCNIVLLQLS